MELEEMKSLWQDLSLKVENQQKIQKELIMEMTKEKFKKKLDGIRIPEMLGTVIAFGYAAYLIFNFGQLNFWFTQVFASFNILFFTLIPLASIMAVYQLRSLQINHLATTEMLGKFRRAKRDFWKVQLVAAWMSGVVILTLAPTLGDIQGKLDRFLQPEFWMIYVPLGLAFIFFFSRYVLSKYRRIMNQSEDILREV